MRYIIGGLLSLLVACQTPNLGVCEVGQLTDKALVLKADSKAASMSRNAVVKVRSEGEDGVGVGTGTVFKYKGETIIITAAHVVRGPEYKVSVADESFLVSAEIIYFDPIADLAVIKSDVELDRKPIPLRTLNSRQIRLGQDVLYSGFPNDSGLLTIEGYIAGAHSLGYLYIHSYAWPGASGSSVLDKYGRVIGILVAVEVGTDVMSFPTIIEDVAIIVPIWRLDFDILDQNIRN